MAERSKAADCKSAGASLRRFESCPPHGTNMKSMKFLFSNITNQIVSDYNAFQAGVAQLARASAFQAEGRGFEARLPLHFSSGGHVRCGRRGVTLSAPVAQLDRASDF